MSQSNTQNTTSTSTPDAHVASGIGALGINSTSLIFQIINFIILYLVLKKFLFAPIAKALEQRRQTIQNSLDKAKAIDEEKKSLDDKQRKILDESLAKADKVISEAKTHVAKLKDESLNTTRQEQDRILKSTQQEMAAIKAKSLEEAKKDISGLVAQATRKVTRGVIKVSENDSVVSQSVKDLG